MDRASERVEFDGVLHNIEKSQLVVGPVSEQPVHIERVNEIDRVLANGFLQQIEPADVYVDAPTRDLHLEGPEHAADRAEDVLARQLALPELALPCFHSIDLALTVEPQLLTRLAHTDHRSHEQEVVGGLIGFLQLAAVQSSVVVR